MLRKIRLTLATVMMILITLLFLDFTGTLHAYLGWMAKIQLLPAVLALNVVVVIALVVLTLIFGRIYCSVICPLGILQDLLSAINRKKNRFMYSPAKTWLRYAVLVLFVAAMLAGFASLAALIAPYSSYGRMVGSLLQPVYITLNNALAAMAQNMDSYAFYDREVWLRSLPTLIIAVVSFAVILVLAFRGGRTYCNTICPVGTVLAQVARFSWFKITIDTEKCKNCRKCERNCKASCINIADKKIDYTRCVACGNCLEECKFGALKYAHPAKADNAGTNQESTAKTGEEKGRRAFLLGTGALLATAAFAQEKKKVDGGLAVIEDKKKPERATKLVPAGALSARNMQQHCTACQLCVSQCPNDVLRPSSDMKTFMQPEMSYERGYCRPECNACSSVCPAGAIKPITLAEKASTQIGHAVWVKKNCVPVADGHECGNCARHCPAGAIIMVHPDGDLSKPRIPAINETRCIGCGACENLCPARPFSAIYVEGHEVHRTV